MAKVLFICTGNYYRSRYAEMLFNHEAARCRLPWRATSSGLRVDFEQRNNRGALSGDARAALERRGIGGAAMERMPRDTTAALLDAADRIIALKRDEHRPMFAARFPDHADRAIYWDVTDVPPGETYDPLAEIEQQVADLVAELGAEARGAAQPQA